MQTMQLITFLMAVGLASALVLVVVRHRRERVRSTVAARAEARTASTGPSGPGARQICPACGRQYPADVHFCPTDARSLVPIGGDAIVAAASGIQCPRCGRLYDANKRYCPFDSEELVAASDSVAVLRAGRSSVTRDLAGAGKICPFCSARYDLDATQCGRDGARLVSVN